MTSSSNVSTSDTTAPPYSRDNIIKLLPTLPIQEDSISFLRNKLLQYEAEQEVFKQKLEKFKKISDDRNELEEELLNRRNKISALQRSLSEIQNCYFEERERASRLKTEIDLHKMKEEDLLRKIRQLLSIVQDKNLKDEIIYIFDQPLGVEVGHRVLSSESDTSQTKVKQILEPRIEEALKILRGQNATIKARLESQSKVDKEYLDAVIKDCRLTVLETEKLSKNDAAKIQDLTQKLKEAEDEVKITNVDLLNIRKKLRREEILREMQKCVLLKRIEDTITDVPDKEPVKNLIAKLTKIIDTAHNLFASIENVDTREFEQMLKLIGLRSKPKDEEINLPPKTKDPEKNVPRVQSAPPVKPPQKPAAKSRGMNFQNVTFPRKIPEINVAFHPKRDKKVTRNVLGHTHSTGQFIHYHSPCDKKSTRPSSHPVKHATFKKSVSSPNYRIRSRSYNSPMKENIRNVRPKTADPRRRLAAMKGQGDIGDDIFSVHYPDNITIPKYVWEENDSEDKKIKFNLPSSSNSEVFGLFGKPKAPSKTNSSSSLKEVAVEFSESSSEHLENLRHVLKNINLELQDINVRVQRTQSKIKECEDNFTSDERQTNTDVPYSTGDSRNTTNTNTAHMRTHERLDAQRAPQEIFDGSFKGSSKMESAFTTDTLRTLSGKVPQRSSFKEKDEKDNLLEELRLTKFRLAKLESYRKSEIEGFQTDLRLLRDKIRDMEKQLHKTILLFNRGEKDLQFLQSVENTTRKSLHVTNEMKRLKAKLYQLEEEFRNAF